jgi:hypothetical protein
MNVPRTGLFGAVALCVLFANAPASAQGTATASLSGVVVDADGGIIPGATAVVTSKATGTRFTATSNASGTFTVPSLDSGVYSVSVSLMGFKTAVIDDVRLQPGIPASVRAVLEVGRLEETITVEGGAHLVNTQTPVVAATMNVDQINQMPLPTRNALNAVTFLTGVNTAGINRDSNVNGLPQSFINITLDGVANNDQFNKTDDGFFASVTPRQDAVEAVTVTMAAGGADVGGHGAVGINFVTRSGTNQFLGSAYEYYRAPQLNTNAWFNERNGLPKNDVKLNQYGFRQGGPISIPGLFDGHNKAFFFVNYEELRLPNNFSRTRTVLHPRAQEGWFRYTVTANGAQQVREVNVLALAAANGQLATVDPLVSRVLGFMNSSASSTGTLNLSSDPLTNDYVWQSPGRQTERQPVVRIDFNLSDRHRLSGTYNAIWVVRDPDQLNNSDRRFPTSNNYSKYTSNRPTRSLALRSTVTNNLVSELRGGWTRGGGSYFGQESSNGIPTFTDTNGYAIDLDFDNVLGPGTAGLTNWHVVNAPTWRSGYSYSVDESLTWLKGKHSILTGGAVFLGRAWENGQQMVPAINLGFNSTVDPANGLFTTANFSGASAGQLTDARALYAMLTGRVLGVTGQAALDADTNQYVAFGPRRRAGKMDEYSTFIQDAWRMTSTLTLNAGVRWDVQMPFSSVNDIMSAASLADICGVSGLGNGGIYNACNFYHPGASGGKTPSFAQLTSGTRGYNTDWNNFAPNVGVAWRPDVHHGWLRALLGDPDQATIRGGYSVAYERQGLGEFTGQFGANPGSTLSLTRDINTGLVGPGETWPVLLREPSRLYNAPFPQTPTFPIAARPNRADSIEAFHPEIEIASARTWSVSLQRAVAKNTAVEVRYVGTRGVNQWSELNYNERNVIENGFYDEFKLAMGNLRANNTSGVASRSGSFAYFGPGTGTSPLPIYLAYLNGSRDAGNPNAYTGGTNTWANSTLTGRLVWTNPNLNTGTANAVIDLDGNLTRRQNALAAGMPANFFVVNPDANAVNVTDSGAFSDYNALQIEVRRRLSRGLQLNGSYQYAIEGGSTFLGFHYGREMLPTNASVRHALKAQWDWKLPFGRGERFGGNTGAFLNGLIGGWQFDGVGRVQARMSNFGNVRLVGMSAAEAQNLYKFEVRTDPATGLRTVYTMPDDVILNTRRAFSVSTTSPTGYSDLGVPEGRYFAPANSFDCVQKKTGDCAPATLMLRSPFFTRVDIGVTKRVHVAGRMNVELRADVLNVFDNVNFTVTDASRTPGAGATIFQTNAAYSDSSNTFDPGGRLGQLVFRFNW